MPTAQIGTTPIAGNTYSWSPTIGLNDASIANPIANPIVNTTYTLTVTTATGCVLTDDVLVKVDKLAPSAGIINDGLELSCIKISTTLKGTGGVNYSWSTGETSQTITVSSLATLQLQLQESMAVLPQQVILLL